MHLEFDERFTSEMVDFFKSYAPMPFNKVPEWYPEMVKAPRLWSASFYATDGRARARMITTTMWPAVRHATRHLLDSHPADLIVTVHPFANTFALRAMRRSPVPFITVVTDMVTTHALWFDKRADLILVPTPDARERAINYHMDPANVRVVGLPVSDRYCQPLADRQLLREKLGWPKDKPVVLMVGGGDGMGPLGKVAVAVDESGLDVTLVIVTGRNRQLQRELEARQWDNPALIYGFTREMPEFMRAADFIVTKAGPGTISEALNAHLPVILYAKLPGQEDGNVTFVVNEGAGVWAPTPQQVVRALTRWISRPHEKARVVETCAALARPDAARLIARSIMECLEKQRAGS
jgi:1,2-diacylglycerol 3-beta-galactosyltransferase